jgi:DDE family transposase
MADLERLVEPTTRGDPESPLRWTCKSVRQLAQELRHQRHQVSHQLVSELLHDLDYSLQANRKTIEGSRHPDRDAQFQHINRRVRAFLRAGDPVISVDTKKKELIGNFKNGGRELRPAGGSTEGSGPRLFDSGVGEGRPLRRLRSRQQQRLGECGS